MTYLRNTWYVAAWSHEITDRQFQRKLLEEAVLLFRDTDGKVIASTNICPHRFAPLHLGKIVEGTIECPYHGLRFNGEGRCVYNPDGDGRIPAGARLRIYPTTERWGAVWIWMGEPERADPALIPAFEVMEDANYRCVTGVLHVRADYRYVSDNIMDQAHLHMVHAHSLACEIHTRAKTQLRFDPDGSVWAIRFGENGAPPPMFDMMWSLARGGPYQGAMDNWAENRWNAPALIENHIGVTPTGRPRNEGIEVRNCHFMTPETKTTTHYFWSIGRGFDLDNPKLDEEIRIGTEHAFTYEDEAMLHAVQEIVEERDFWSMRPALMQSDVGTVELRRALERLIDAEQRESMPAPLREGAA